MKESMHISKSSKLCSTLYILSSVNSWVKNLKFTRTQTGGIRVVSGTKMAVAFTHFLTHKFTLLSIIKLKAEYDKI